MPRFRSLLLRISVILGLASSVNAQTVHWQRTNFSVKDGPTSIACGKQVFATGPLAVYSSSDSGVTWDSLKRFGAEYVEGAFTSDSSVYVIAVPRQVTDTYVLFRSTDDGVSWDSLGWYPAGTVFSSHRGFGFLEVFGSLIWMTPDSWKSLDTASFAPDYYLAAASDSLLVATRDSGRQYQLVVSDDFATWHRGVIFDSSISSIAADGKTLWAGCKAGLFRSNDLGMSWQLVNADCRAQNIVVRNEIIVALSDSGVFLSWNHGRTWQVSNDGLPNHSVWPLAIGDGVLYAGTSNGQIYRADIPTHSAVAATPNAQSMLPYPNPCDASTILTNIGDPADVTVYNALGELVTTLPRTASEITLDTHNWPAGFYYALIDANGQKQSARFVVAH